MPRRSNINQFTFHVVKCDRYPEGRTDMKRKDAINQELVATTPSRRNWRGILISLIVIGFICFLIFTCVVLLTPPDLGPRDTGRPVSVNDIIKNTFDLQPFSGEWLNDDDLAFRDDDGGVSVYSARTQTTRTLVTNRTLRQTNANEFAVSPDLKFVLLVGERSKNGEDYNQAKFWVWPVDTGYTAALRPGPRQPERRQLRLQLAAWLPAGRGAPPAALFFVHDNNLYYKQRADSADALAVTGDGRPGSVYHGAADPLYREHILRSDRAVWPSPDGSSLLYFTTNSTATPDLPYTVYGPARSPKYPTVHDIKYPMAGVVNPVLTVTVVNVSEPRQMKYSTVQPPEPLAQQDLYAAGVRWLDDGLVSITWYNRRQNVSHVTACAAPDWICQTVYRREAPGGWLEIEPPPAVCPDGRSLLLRDSPVDGGDGPPQIVKVNVLTRTVDQITEDGMDVEILACGDDFIYYLSSLPDQPGQRHLFRVTSTGSAASVVPHCMTCSQITAPGSPHSDLCLYHDAVFSASARHYALLCMGPAVPHVTVSSAGAPQMALLRNNTRLRAAAANASVPAARCLRLLLASGRTALVRLLVPPQYRHGDQLVYPMVVRPAGPAARGHRWSVDWASYLASQRQMVVADVALSAPAGPWTSAADAADLRDAVANLTATLRFVTPQKVVAAGSGYGALLALRLLAHHQKPLNCAVAIAPITSWRNYASAASERRLGLLDDSQRRYSEEDGSQWAAGLANRRLLLVHGTADVTVSVQHTFLLSRWLEMAGVLFRQMIYPDQPHALSGVLEHLYNTVDQYLDGCLLPPDLEQLLPDA